MLFAKLDTKQCARLLPADRNPVGKNIPYALENNAFGKVWYFRRRTRACLKDVFHKMCFTLYGVQIAGMIFQTHSGARLQFEIYNYIIIK